MELKNLGSTSLMVPEIGLGTWKHSERELLPYCQEHHVIIIADGSLATPSRFLTNHRLKVIEQVADHYGPSDS